MGMAERFQDFILELRVDKIDLVQGSLRKLALCLNEHFWHIDAAREHMYLTGSYGRGTAIVGLEKVDMCFVLPQSVFEEVKEQIEAQELVLNKMFQCLTSRFRDIQISEGRKYIRIPFGDWGFYVKLTPVFINPDGSNTYGIGGLSPSWQLANPAAEIKAVNNYQTKYGARVVHLAKIIRAWVQTHKVPMSGILTDTLVMDFFDRAAVRYTYSFYDVMFNDFMKYLLDIDAARTYWIVPGSGTKIYREADLTSYAIEAYRYSLQAIMNKGQDPPTKSMQLWRHLLGISFC
ncbi:MAG: hypothetical protein WCI30_00130 [Clostridia bacterium]